MAPTAPPICPYCGAPARRVLGSLIYPRRVELADKVMYSCAPCEAWVGCHPGTDRPLGRLANAELRRAKMAAHAAFDPIWRERIASEGVSKKVARNSSYSWLARELGIERDACHIGMMDAAMCRRVVEVCNSRKKRESVS